MKKPKLGREYQLVRREGDRLLFAKFLRFEDGSGMVEVDGQHIRFELDQTLWSHYWTLLNENGYVEMEEALQQNLVTPDELIE